MLDFNALRKDLDVWERGEQSAPREWAQAYVNLQNAAPHLARLAFLVPKMADLLHSEIEEDFGGNGMIDFDQLRKDLEAATPGPWFIRTNKGYAFDQVEGDSGGFCVTDVEMGRSFPVLADGGDYSVSERNRAARPGEVVANARLIARAPDLARLALLVPELREAMRMAEQQLVDHGFDGYGSGLTDALAKLDALLADIGKEG